MKKLFESDAFSNQGQRENNEDCVFPNAEIPTMLENLFLVCDGVGGLNKGEEASDLCCTQFSGYFAQNKIDISTKETIDDAVKFVDKKFDSFMTNNPESMDMASTFTLMHLHQQGVTVGHMGDSRIYQFRDGEIIFKTKDHSVVQELFDAGVINEEEMTTHRDKNRISRAMRGASVKSYKADTTVLTDVKANDIFFMCTDGVLESFNDNELKEVFASTSDIETINAKIVRKCAEMSRDNYSAYTVKINQAYVDTLQSLEKVVPIEEESKTQIFVEEKTEVEETKIEIKQDDAEVQEVKEETKINDETTKQEIETSKKVDVQQEQESTNVEKLSEPTLEEEQKTFLESETKRDNVDKMTFPKAPSEPKVENQIIVQDDLKEKAEAPTDPLKQTHEPSTETDEKPASKFKTKLIGLVGLLIGILLGGFLVYHFFFKEDKKEPEPKPEQTSHVQEKLEHNADEIAQNNVAENTSPQLTNAEINANETLLLDKNDEANQQREEAKKKEAERIAKKRQQAEENAWGKAKETNTIASYQNYLSQYPNGKHRSEATQKKTRLTSSLSNSTKASLINKTFFTNAKEFKNKGNYVAAIGELEKIKPQTKEVKNKIESFRKEGDRKATNMLARIKQKKEKDSLNDCDAILTAQYKPLRLLTKNQEILKQIPKCK